MSAYSGPTNVMPLFARRSGRSGRLNHSDAQEKNTSGQDRTRNDGTKSHVGARAHSMKHGPKVKTSKVWAH